MSISPEAIFSILIGIGLAASVGFRIFVPLFTLSLTSYFSVISLNENWEWIGSSTALIILGIATLFEILAYLIPWVDNLLDAIAVPLAAIAGTAIMVATVSELEPTITWALAIIAGGGSSIAIKGATSAARLASTATTAGIANPVISAIETGTSILMSIFSIFIPVLAIICVIIILWLLFKVFKFYKPSKPAE